MKLLKITKPLINFVTTLLVIIIGLTAIVFLIPSLPPTKDLYSLVVVRSGSMEPTIKIGSIIIYFPADYYEVDDVVAFINRSASKEVLTIHRIVGVADQDGEQVFTTKGDANEVDDPNILKKSDMKGKVRFSVPFVGYYVSWMKTSTGMMTMVVLPLALLGYHEISNYINKKNQKKIKKDQSDDQKIES